MSRFGVLLVASAALVVATPASTGVAGTTAAKPSLRVVAKAPLKVRGLYFKRSERVRVVAKYRGTTYTRIARASRTGTFLATFTPLTADPACALELRAIGSRRSRAVFKLPERFCPTPMSLGRG